MNLKFEVIIGEYRHHTRDELFNLAELRRDLVFYVHDHNILKLKIRRKDKLYCYLDVDITGWEFFVIGKINPTDADSSAIVYRHVTVLTDPIEGETDIDLIEVSGEDFSGNLVYQLRAKDNHGNFRLLGEGLLQFKQSLFGEI